MRFATPLIPARLIRRYKRFLADMVLEDGREVVVHCPNPGSMMGMAEPGMRCWIEPNDDPRKKLKYGWRLVEVGGAMVGVDTGVPNRVVRAALEAGIVPGVSGYSAVRAEVKFGAGSRVDFVLSGARDIYVEVKSVTLCREPGLAEFPDSVTVRGAKHLAELSQVVAAGHRGVMLYLVQRDDCDRVGVAGDIDPAYFAAFEAARAAGVEVICLGCAMDVAGVEVAGALPLAL